MSPEDSRKLSQLIREYAMKLDITDPDSYAEGQALIKDLQKLLITAEIGDLSEIPRRFSQILKS